LTRNGAAPAGSISFWHFVVLPSCAVYLQS